jgi:dihydrofolate reductase
MTPPIGLVWAQADGGVIGADGGMPWRVPEDLAHFKAITLGNPVVMGRKTWDSLTPRFRPLPGRRNIVITRQPGWQADGADVAHSLDDALGAASADPPVAAPAPPVADRVARIWVIGGGQVFRDAIVLADRLEVTEINGRFRGDAFAPEIDDSWVAAAVEPASGWRTSSTGIEYRFLRYDRA